MDFKDYIPGGTYRDTVSGFEGVGTAFYTYLNGCIRIELSGKVKEDGKIPAIAIDIQQIEFVSAPVNPPQFVRKQMKRMAKRAQKQTREMEGAGARTGGPRDSTPAPR